MRSLIVTTLALAACGRLADQGGDAGDMSDAALVDAGPVCSVSSSPSPKATCNFRWGNGTLQEPYAIAADSLGDTVLVGGFAGTLTFGPDTINWPYTEPGSLDGPEDQAFAVLFNATCEPQWAVAFGGESLPAYNVVALPQERFAVAYPDGNPTALSTTIAVINHLGETVWTKHFVATPTNNPSGWAALWMLASDRAGNIFLGGTLNGTIDFGGGSVASSQPDDVGVLVKLDADGDFIFNKTFAPNDYGFRGGTGLGPLSVDASGQVWVVGTLEHPATVDFGGGVIAVPADASADDYLGYIARLSAADGHFIGAATFDTMQMTGLASDPCTGRTTVVGNSGPLTAQSGFVMQFDSEGKSLWTQTTIAMWPPSIAIDAAGNVVVAGSHEALDAGIYATDVIVNGYDLTGASRYSYSWSTMLPTPNDASSGALVSAATVGGAISIIGSIGSFSTIDFGLGALPEETDTGNPFEDGFFVRLD